MNAALDAWLLILAVQWLDAGRPNAARILIASTVGGLYACAAWMNAWMPLRNALVSLPVALVMARLATDSVRFSVAVKTAGFFLAATALTGGAAFALINLAPRIHPMLAVALAVLLSGAAARAFIGSRRKTRLTYGRINLLYRDNQCAFDAAVDTGNQAIDPFSGLPVVVMRHEVAASLFPLLKDNAFDLSDGLRLIPVRTVSGTALLPCFTPEVITWNEHPIRAAVAVAPRGLITVALAPSCLTEAADTAKPKARRMPA